MDKRWFFSMLTMLGLAFFTRGNAGEAKAKELGPGSAAPPFEMQGSDGKTYSLDGLKGKMIVIAWFPKAFTGGCTAECKSMHENSEALKKLDAAYFAASVDEPDLNMKFAESLELDYPILSDPTKEVAKKYGVLADGGYANRWTFYIGADGKILYVDKAVKPASAGADVAAKIKELAAAEEKKKAPKA